MRIQHEPFINASLVCCHACCDTVELGVGVEALILHGRSAPPHMHCCQPQALQKVGRSMET